MHTCKVTIGSVLGLTLLVLTSSCGGSGNMGAGTAGGGGPVGPSLYVTQDLALAPSVSSIMQY